MDLLKCNDLRAGVMLLSWNWSVKLVLSVPSGSNHSRHRRTELDSCRLIRKDIGPISFSTMKDDCRKVLGALKGRGCVLPASNWFIQNRFQVGQTPGSWKLLKTRRRNLKWTR
jgi:hypothetical protein